MNQNIIPTPVPSTNGRRRRRAVVAVTGLVAAVAAPLVGLTADAGGSNLPVSVTPVAAPAAAPQLPAPRMAPMPRMATLGVDLCATTGTAALPRSSGTTVAIDTIAIWGYVDGDCTTGSGTATLGGAPVIVATEGDTVNITLHNDLAETTSISFQGQTLPTDMVGAAPGGTASYSLNAAHAGTFLYEAGFANNTVNQVAMGLHGVLVVLPTTPGQAYASPTTAFDAESVVVISDIDPALNANPTGFDMRNFAPKWTTLNGQVFPATAPLATVAAGDNLLLRYVNASVDYHSLAVLGADQRIIADDGNPLTYDYTVVAQTVGPGQTTDVIVSVSLAAADGSQLTVYDASLQVRNRNRRPAANGTFRTYGGAMAFVDINGSLTSGDIAGPVSSGAGASSTTGVVNATVSDVTTGNSNITAAEYSIDVIAPAGTGVAMTATDAAFDSPTEAVTATIPAPVLASLPTGTHTVYVRGQDAVGNWGAVTATTMKFDTSGPITSGVTLTPNPSQGNVAVALHATGSDVTTGNANVDRAEYFIDAPVVDGAGTLMAINNQLPTASLDATISPATMSGLAAGVHTVTVHARDVLGNWGPGTAIDLVIETAGPTTSALTVNPNPTNGLVGVNQSTPALRVRGSATDGDANVVAAEGFIDTVGANGTGFPFVPVDGAWNSSTESINADIPITTIRPLSEGTHTIYVHAKDATGNWGAIDSVVFTVDKTAPVQSNLVVTTGVNAAAVAIDTVDPAGISRVEFYVDTDPGAGLGTAMALQAGSTYSGAIPVAAVAEGNHTVFVRSRDAAGNWSTSASTTLSVVRTLRFSTTGNTNPPGVGGTADNADTAVPGLGAVQDEDIVYYAAGVWSVYFDGTAAGLTANAQDVDAFDIDGSTIYFSTTGNSNPPGVAGTADNADVYSWNGATFARVFDATANGIPGAGNVDGLAFVDATHFYVSFAADLNVGGGFGAVQDEDILYRDGSTWRLWFDGTAKGLTNNNHDVDAIDVP